MIEAPWGLHIEQIWALSGHLSDGFMIPLARGPTDTQKKCAVYPKITEPLSRTKSTTFTDRSGFRVERLHLNISDLAPLGARLRAAFEDCADKGLCEQSLFPQLNVIPGIPGMVSCSLFWGSLQEMMDKPCLCGSPMSTRNVVASCF